VTCGLWATAFDDVENIDPRKPIRKALLLAGNRWCDCGLVNQSDKTWHTRHVNAFARLFSAIRLQINLSHDYHPPTRTDRKRPIQTFLDYAAWPHDMPIVDDLWALSGLTFRSSQLGQW
jgi:hypothetical protein